MEDFMIATDRQLDVFVADNTALIHEQVPFWPEKDCMMWRINSDRDDMPTISRDILYISLLSSPIPKQARESDLLQRRH